MIKFIKPGFRKKITWGEIYYILGKDYYVLGRLYFPGSYRFRHMYFHMNEAAIKVSKLEDTKFKTLTFNI